VKSVLPNAFRRWARALNTDFDVLGSRRPYAVLTVPESGARGRSLA
jgi:hypothetical protein